MPICSCSHAGALYSDHAANTSATVLMPFSDDLAAADAPRSAHTSCSRSLDHNEILSPSLASCSDRKTALSQCSDHAAAHPMPQSDLAAALWPFPDPADAVMHNGHTNGYAASKGCGGGGDGAGGGSLHVLGPGLLSCVQPRLQQPSWQALGPGQGSAGELGPKGSPPEGLHPPVHGQEGGPGVRLLGQHSRTSTRMRLLL
jgi:hypothetical protein